MNNIYDDMPPTLIKEFKHASGYIIRHELVYVGYFDPEREFYFMKNAYNHNGDYIGQPRDARFICEKMGIKPELVHKDMNVCSIGFCEKEQKWYGWSHRAICGFGIGDKVFDEKYGSHLSEKRRDKIPFIKHGKITIKTLAQARIAAAKFANYVG